MQNTKSQKKIDSFKTSVLSCFISYSCFYSHRKSFHNEGIENFISDKLLKAVLKAPIEILKVAEESLLALDLSKVDKRAALIKSDKMDEKMISLSPNFMGIVRDIYRTSEKYKQFEKVLIPIKQTD